MRVKVVAVSPAVPPKADAKPGSFEAKGQPAKAAVAIATQIRVGETWVDTEATEVLPMHGDAAKVITGPGVYDIEPMTAIRRTVGEFDGRQNVRTAIVIGGIRAARKAA